MGSKVCVVWVGGTARESFNYDVTKFMLLLFRIKCCTPVVTLCNMFVR